MNLRKSLALGSLCVTIATASAAMGGGKGMRANMPSFADFDLDGDGKISGQEFTEGHEKHMAKMAAEGRKMKCAGGKMEFEGIDADGDGFISEAEFAKHQAGQHGHKHRHGEKDQST